jgi:nucleotide-binding universal stress UspA family protein
LHVLESGDPALAICQAAERLDARVICIGTHGRTGLAKVVLGSVAQAVLGGTGRPVLLARRPIE